VVELRTKRRGEDRPSGALPVGFCARQEVGAIISARHRVGSRLRSSFEGRRAILSGGSRSKTSSPAIEIKETFSLTNSPMASIISRRGAEPVAKRANEGVPAKRMLELSAGKGVGRA